MKASSNLRLLLSIFLFLILTILYTYKLNLSFSVNPDFGRDIFEIQKITNGNFTLIGPILSAGFFASPLYFYFFTPVLTLFHATPISIVYANTFIFSAVISLIFLLLSKKLSVISSFVFTLIFSIIPQVIYSARYPSNSLTYVPFLFLLISYPVANKVNTKLRLFLLGILSFICLSFHPISIIGIVPLVLWLLLFNKNRLNVFIFYLVPTILFIAPNLLFELKHHFIITQNFLSQFHTFETQVPKVDLISKVFSSVNFVNQTLVNNFSPFIFVFILGATIIFLWKYKKYSAYEKILFVWTWLSYFIIILILPKQELHYLIPLEILLIIQLFLAFSKTKYLVSILSTLILLILANFPNNLYTTSNRPLSRFETAANIIAENYPNMKNEKFNIIQVSDSNISVPAGHEYRFFLVEKGITPLPESDYANATTLVIFSEIPSLKISAMNNWEINQFGKMFQIKEYKTNGVDIFVLTK